MESPSVSKLWVKHNGGPSVKVPIKGCANIDDFAEKVKRKLNSKCQVALFTSLEKEALDPGLSISELLKTVKNGGIFKLELNIRNQQNALVCQTHSCYSGLNCNKDYIYQRY